MIPENPLLPLCPDGWIVPQLVNAYKLRPDSLIKCDDQGALLHFSKGFYLIHQPDQKTAALWLEKAHEMDPITLLFASGSESMKAALESPLLSLENASACHEYIWTKKEKPVLNGSLSFKPASLEDYGWIRERYDLADDQELKETLENERLFLAYDHENHLVGYGGMHSEGSMGMLEIFSDFRRKGYGAQFEKFLCGWFMDEGLIPFCHVFDDNTASQKMNEEIGMEETDHPVWWIF